MGGAARHFTLRDEPYPDTYFDFPVSSAYLRKSEKGMASRICGGPSLFLIF